MPSVPSSHARGRRVQPALSLLAWLLAGPGHLAGEEWRSFRNKEGQEIVARPARISPDRKTVRIEREDGKSFDLVITQLSLDDQQYLRGWLLERAERQPGGVNLNLSLKKRETERERVRLSGPVYDAQWEARELSYEIQVTSLATDPLAGLRLEYCLLLEDQVEILPSAPGADEATPPWRILRAGRVRYLHGQLDLPPLEFNRPHQAQTAAMVRDLLKPSRGAREPAEDRVIGVMTRILSSRGEVLAEHSELARESSGMDWSLFAQRRDPAEAGGSGILGESVAAN